MPENQAHFGLHAFIEYVILTIERGEAREAAYPRHYSFNLLQGSAVIIRGNGGYFRFPLKIV